jgi:hypothetical protein
MGRVAVVGAAIALAFSFAFTALRAYADGQAFPAVRGNPADRLADLPIDDYAYDRARRCRRTPRAGTVSLEAWLARHFRGVSWGIMRCERLHGRVYSLHADGRALDWHLDVHDKRDRAEAWRLIGMLLAPDRVGNPEALARRMGVQEIIWDCRAWWSGGGPVMDKYWACYNKRGRRRRHVNQTIAHRDHVHIGLSRHGAARMTSFWVGR